jgi:hypothetical protein
MNKAFKIFEKNKLKNKLTSKIIGGRGSETCIGKQTRVGSEISGDWTDDPMSGSFSVSKTTMSNMMF